MLPDDHDELFYQIALTFVPDVGAKYGRALYNHFGSATEIFKAPLKAIKAVNGIGEIRAKGFKDPEILPQAEKQIQHIIKHHIRTLAINDAAYPKRLQHCSDAPLLLYTKGNTNFEATKIVAIVGTRKNTDYGMRMTEMLVEGLQGQEDLLIVSGLATGIDAIAHKKSVQLGIPTLGVLGHGLDRVYPAENKKLAEDMQQNGGLLTEFHWGVKPDRNNFPMRNRVVAGLSDVTVVVESPLHGGSLITAYMANGYNREVAAFPGRVGDARSAGCNDMIRANTAAIITSADDLLELMNWKDDKPKAVQKQLFLNLSEPEQQIVDALQGKDAVHADELYHQTGMANSQLAATLLGLEMQGIIRTLPGKNYRMG